MSTTKKQVAAYFTALVNASPKNQYEIAKQAGFDSANTISMLKNGKTKIPFARIPALAKALDSDPKEMFAMALEAYEPELFKIYSALAPSMLISTQELRLVQSLRTAARVGVLK
jgi:hypothetical protein